MNQTTNLAFGDKIKLNIFTKERELELINLGDSNFDDNGNYTDKKVELNKKELEVLNYILTNIDLNNYKQEITDYCNECYAKYGNTKICIEDIENEVKIKTIFIRITNSNKSNKPEIAFGGNCKCDLEHGICIGFKDNEFIGVGPQDWIL